VRFQIEYICQQTTTKKILGQGLKNLKTSSSVNSLLDATYDRVIENINQKSKARKDLSITMFTWLVSAKRLLKIDELRVALSIDEGKDTN
jgi:hypothetical protein